MSEQIEQGPEAKQIELASKVELLRKVENVDLVPDDVESEYQEDDGVEVKLKEEDREVDGVDEKIASEALRKAGSKLPIKVRIISRVHKQ